jgi:hypothetical protein
MRVLLIACPGAGKGAQVALIAARFAFPVSRLANCCAITSRGGPVPAADDDLLVEDLDVGPQRRRAVA